MTDLIRLHETASKLVWNIEKCRKLQKIAFDSIIFAARNKFLAAEKDASEKLALYKKCEERFKQRYVNILTKINKTEL